MFYAHLAAMTSSLVTATLVHMCREATLTHWFERWTFGVGAAALFWSFGLPSAMVNAQVAKLTKATDEQTKMDKYNLSADAPFDDASQ